MVKERIPQAAAFFLGFNRWAVSRSMMERARADIPTEGEAESTDGLNPLLDLAQSQHPQTPEFFILEYLFLHLVSLYLSFPSWKRGW